jgi:hypothetical protein
MGVPSNTFPGTKMPVPTPWRVAPWSTADVRGSGFAGSDIPALNSIAVHSLVSLFDEKTHLFRQRVMAGEAGIRRDEVSRKHTIIALLGLHRLAEAARQPFDVAAIQDVVFEDRRWVKSVGDLGLLTWFTSICRPDRLGVLFDEFDFENALQTYEDGREAQTAGLAWFLTGIAHSRLACPSPPRELADVAVDAYHLLQNNQSHTGIFGHAGAARFPRRAFYNRFGTFSDQMCAIFALSMFAQAFQVEEPLEAALACGNTVCELQGVSGQWWFLYDKRTCRVVVRYPVLSLHQYGAAPCALLALGDATGRSFHEAISKGLSGIAGGNELGNDLRNADQTFMWNSIGPKGRLAKCREATLGFLAPSREETANHLEVRYDAQSDAFSWLLYAFGSFGLPNASLPPTKVGQTVRQEGQGRSR